MSWHVCGSWRATYGGRFASSATWDPGIKSRPNVSPGGEHLHLSGHFTGPLVHSERYLHVTGHHSAQAGRPQPSQSSPSPYTPHPSGADFHTNPPGCCQPGKWPCSSPGLGSKWDSQLLLCPPRAAVFWGVSVPVSLHLEFLQGLALLPFPAPSLSGSSPPVVLSPAPPPRCPIA